MLKIGKKVVSVILVLCLMCSVLSMSAFAASDNVDGSQGVQTGIGDDMNVKSTNSFGSLLTSELEQEADKQEENNGINIFSVEVTGETATAEFETLQDSTLVVAIYDESGVEMLASGRTAVVKEDTTAEVTIDIETMPKYFYLKAFLVDEEVYRPLCTAYESPNYTQEMQEFFAKTTDDFADDSVLNLDNDKTNNFAVYDDETKIIEPNGSKNQVASVDDESKKYVIKNADSSITSLKSGDIFSYNYGDDEILIVKVKSISVNGTTATIYGDEASMDEVFDYVKIDGKSDLSDADYDSSACDDGITYEGMNDEKINPKSSSPVGTSLEGNINASLKFSLQKEIGGVTIKGSFDLGVNASAKVYITVSYKYLELRIGYSLKLSASLSGKILEIKIPFGLIGISPVPGVYIEFTPSFVIEGDVKVELSGTLSGALGLKVSNTDGIQNTTSAPSFKPEFKIEGTVFAGLSLEPKIKVLGCVATAKLDAKLGAEVTASFSESKEDTKQIHECDNCLEGEINAKATLTFEVKFLNSDKMKFTFKALDLKYKLFDFYWSLDYMSFGFTTCPYLKYKTTVMVKDEGGKSVSGATVYDKYTTDSNGEAEFYLNGGYYIIIAKYNNLKGAKLVSVEGEPTRVVITLSKYATDSEINIDKYLYVENSEYEDWDRYIENMGDSFIEKVNTRNYAEGINGNTYEHGLEIWLARWNYLDESSWVWKRYKNTNHMQYLLGTLTYSIRSHNTSNFKIHFEIYGDSTLLYSTIITQNDKNGIPISVNIRDYDTFTIKAYDEISVSGGTSLIFGDARLTNKLNNSGSEKTTTDGYTPTNITIPSSNLKSSESVFAGSDYNTEKFTNLLPNEVYNFYSMKTQNAENPFGSVNLLYITQATTDENGRLSVTYMPDESYDKAVNFVVPLKQTDLSTAVVSMKGLIYNGKEQYVTPFVTLNGKTLVEGDDYELSGDYFAKDAGIYTVTINGRGLYTGEVDFNYTVFTSVKPGDVNLDGTVNIDDVTLIQKYIANMSELDGEQLKAADVTGDGDVSIDDVTKIQKFIAGLVSSLSNV